MTKQLFLFLSVLTVSVTTIFAQTDPNDPIYWDIDPTDGWLSEYTGPGGDIVIPEGVKEISFDAFETVKDKLTSVVIPEGVTEIKDGTFQDCSELTTVTLPEGLETIEGGAFYRSTKLTKINFPASLKKIGSSAFAYCCNLSSVSVGWTAGPPEYINIDSPFPFSIHCSSDPFIRFLYVPEGTEDLYIAKNWNKYFTIVGYNSVESIASSSFTVSPSPFTESVSISGAGDSDLRIADLSGRVLYTKDKISDSERIETAQWERGIYVLTIRSGSKLYAEKIVKK